MSFNWLGFTIQLFAGYVIGWLLMHDLPNGRD
jgi:hypothetical protein